MIGGVYVAAWILQMTLIWRISAKADPSKTALRQPSLPRTGQRRYPFATCGKLQDMALLDTTVTDQFSAHGVYLNTASIGPPPCRTLDALDDVQARWRDGLSQPSG